MNTFLLTKASGSTEAFSPDKYRRALERSGSSGETIDHLLEAIEKHLYNGMSTRELYYLTRTLLKQHKLHGTAGRLHVKQALMLMGPSGYPFEDFVSHLLAQEGYAVKVRQLVPGTCITHEIDVLATKNNQTIIVECKFHQKTTMCADLQDMLALKARRDDLSSYHEALMVTNTKISSTGTQYGECNSVKMLTWEYPADNNLADLIEKHNLYPITCLSSLSKIARDHLLRKSIVLCKEIAERSPLALTILQESGHTQTEIEALIHEARLICS